MLNDDAVLKVYESGPLTVIGFGGRDVLENVNLAAFREQVAALVRQNGCHTLAFDLSGVKLIPSGLLGLLASLRRLGVAVEIYNPSPDVRDVLRVTRLDQIMPVQDVEP